MKKQRKSDAKPKAQQYDARLESWFISGLIYGALQGTIMADKKERFKDGTFVHTSIVKLTGKEKEGDVVETLNSRYKLGKEAKPRVEGVL